MIRTRVLILAAVAVTSISISASAQQAAAIPEGKVAAVNTQVFPERIGELKQKYEQVNAQYQDRYKRLQDLEKEIGDLEKQFVTQSPTLSPEKAQEMKDSIDTKKRRGQREAEDFQAEYNKSLEATTKPVRDKLAQFIQNYATQRSIMMIIRLPEAYQSGMIAFTSPGVDITEDFITEYNKANPVPAGAATGAPSRPNTPTTQPVKPGAKPN